MSRQAFYPRMYVLLLGSFLLLIGHPAGAVEQKQSAAYLGVANDLLEIGFNAETGALVRLHNRATDDEYLKEALNDGNPFRVYLDPTELPPPLKDPNWWSGKIEGAMGGQLIEANQCKVIASEFTRQAGRTTLILTTAHAASGLQFRSEVSLADGDCGADWSLTVRNMATEPHGLMTAFPHISGLQLGASRETNRSLMLASFGTPDVKAWTDGGGFHGRETSMQWEAVYDPPRNEGLGFIVMDPDLRPKLIRRAAPSTMSVLYVPAQRLAPGEEFKYPTARIIVHKGNWRVVARRYHEWLETAFTLRRHPAWLHDVDLFVGPWIPSADAVTKNKAQLEDARKAGHPIPELFASYRDLPLLYLNDCYDAKEWAQYNEGVAVHPETYGAYMSDGTFEFRGDLGGAAAMREGVERAHRIGRRVIFYVAGYSVLEDSAIFAGSNIDDWKLMDAPGHMWDIGYPDGISVCPGYLPRQEQLARTCRRILAESGADGIRLDELGSFVPCHNPAHHHASPYDSLRWHREHLRKVRAAKDEVNPDAILGTEGPIDFFRESCDYALQMFQPGRDIDAMRVAIPDYTGFAYHPGAVESALNGWVGGKTTARRTEWPWAHRGLSGRPDWYQEGPGPELRWHELRASFRDAIVEGDVTLEDPVAPDDSHWVGRLWRAKEYCLLVGGHLDATALNGPMRVRLPELPESVAAAFEIDADTLEIADAQLARTSGGVFVTVAKGLGAVLLPTPKCPPLLKLDPQPISLRPGEEKALRVDIFCPWNSARNAVNAFASAPGLEVIVNSVTLPGAITLKAPSTVQAGNYPLSVKGNCLPLKRWVSVVR